MKIQIFIFICCVVAACYKPDINPKLRGLWKVDKVEVMKDGELKRLIKDSSQYWQIYQQDSIRIFTPEKLQNCFPVTIHKSSITGPADEFIIDKLNDESLELSSNKKMQEANYTVIYYLDRVVGDDH